MNSMPEFIPPSMPTIILQNAALDAEPQLSEPRFDFVSRFFAPGVGIDEDPVTGSAHCCLGAYWRRQLGKTEFLAFQASARGGVVRVRVDNKRAYLGGKAVKVLKGELLA